MIPVHLQPEPEHFDEQVRKSGREWLEANGIDVNDLEPASEKFPPFWRKFSREIWESYGGVCAYLAIYFEFATGASSTDHFIPKSRHAGGVYEWNNYRLACLSMNRNKNDFQDVIDPVGMKEGMFQLNFGSGSIFPSPFLDPAERDVVEKTIRRLKLDSHDLRRMRIEHFNEYMNNKVSVDYLQRKSPFVWAEAARQNLL